MDYFNKFDETYNKWAVYKFPSQKIVEEFSHFMIPTINQSFNKCATISDYKFDFEKELLKFKISLNISIYLQNIENVQFPEWINSIYNNPDLSDNKKDELIFTKKCIYAYIEEIRNKIKTEEITCIECNNKILSSKLYRDADDMETLFCAEHLPTVADVIDPDIEEKIDDEMDIVNTCYEILYMNMLSFVKDPFPSKIQLCVGEVTLELVSYDEEP